MYPHCSHCFRSIIYLTPWNLILLLWLHVCHKTGLIHLIPHTVVAALSININHTMGLYNGGKIKLQFILILNLTKLKASFLDRNLFRKYIFNLNINDISPRLSCSKHNYIMLSRKKEKWSKLTALTDDFYF